LMARLVTYENIQRLGFVEWKAVKDVVAKAFGEGDVSSFRLVALLAQWVVLSQKFGIEEAQPQ
jgi:asparagine synthase (glutamine-hydrolysing)